MSIVSTQYQFAIRGDGSPWYTERMSEYKLHLGNCLDFIRILDAGSVDAVVTDPPYNIGFNGYESYSDNLPDDEYVELLCVLQNFPRVAISHYPEEMMRYVVPALGPPHHVSAWCYNAQIPRRFRLINYYGLRPDYSRIQQPYKNMSDRRIKWRIENGSSGTGIYEWWDDIQLVKNVSEEKTEHPCPLPEGLVERVLILCTEPEWTIFDPFMGSGTTGVACMRLGRNFIGCEIDPGYYAIAEKRIREASAQMLLPLE